MIFSRSIFIIFTIWVLSLRAVLGQDSIKFVSVGKPIISIDTVDIPQSALAPMTLLNVKNADLRDVLRGIAEQYNINLIVDNKVDQKITVRLYNIPIIEGIKFLCEEYGLELSQVGQIFRIKQPPKPEPPKPEPRELNITVQDGLLSIDLLAEDLYEVIKTISQKSGENIVLRRGVSGSISGFLQDVQLDIGLKTLMNNSGYSLRKKDNIYIIDRYGMSSSDKTSGNSFWVNVQNGMINLDVVNSQISDVLREIAFQMDINLITYGDVKGTITAKCSNITLEQSLNYLFKGTNYTYRKENNIYFVGDKKISGIATTRLIRLKHIKADGIIELLPDEIKRNATLQVIKEQNGLMAIGTQDVILALENFLDQIDYPTPQILIEALVVDFETSFLRDLNISFGAGGSRDSSVIGNFFNFGKEGYQAQQDGQAVSKQINKLADLFGVKRILRLPDNFYLTIQALEREGFAHIRSRPQIATLNGHTARISIGTTQYFILTSTTPLRSTSEILTQETQRFEKIEANISLEITPWVGASGEVTTEIHPEFNTPVGALDPNVPPTINSRVLDSTVRLKDGETIILGGLIQESKSTTYNKLPILGDIPFFGRLFRNQNHNNRKTELIIYITPHVFYGDEKDQEKWEYLKENLDVEKNKKG